MKQIVVFLSMLLLLTSCGTQKEIPVNEEISTTQETEMSETIEDTEAQTNDAVGILENVIDMETSNISEPEVTPEENNVDFTTDITFDLENGTEDEQLLNEVLNEINEVYELAEQNDGQ